MDTQHNYQWLHAEGTTPIKGWVNGVPLEAQAHEQLRNIAAIPFVGPWVAVMPDVHLGKGATVGSVIPTRGAIIPAAVGVDIGCGMAAVRTTLRANDLPDDLRQLRNSIERSIPVGNGRGGEHHRMPDSIHTRLVQSGLAASLEKIKDRHRRIRTDKLDRQLGTLGGGNHFIELCLDETDTVWVMLHSGSRGTGNLIGTYFIEKAREELVTRKGAVSAREGELGIIPGSMGTRSYIVRGKGNADSFHSCSHGAGRVMSRGTARQQITLAQHREATAHVECRKDSGVLDESPAAYKSIDDVMAAQLDLVEVVHTLRQVLCVKG